MPEANPMSNNPTREEEEHTPCIQFSGTAEQRNTKALWGLMVVMFINMVVQLVLAILSGSLAMLGDSICAVIDTITYGFNLLAEKYGSKNRWLPHATACASMVALIAVCIWILVEAEDRIGETLVADDSDATLMIIGGVINLIADIIGWFLLEASGGAEAGGDDLDAKGRKHNMRSALVHVLADALRATAVIAIAMAELIDSREVNLTKVDAWVAFFISLTIILGSVYALARSGWSWYQEVHSGTDPEVSVHSHKEPAGVGVAGEVKVEINKMNEDEDGVINIKQDRV